MGVVILAGQIPRRAYRPLTKAIWERGGSGPDNKLRLVRFGLEYKFEGGPSAEELDAQLYERLGLENPAELSADAVQELLARELIDLQQEVWDEAWGDIDGDEPILAVICGPEYLDSDSWSWLDDGETFEKATPFYVLHPFKNGSGRLRLQKGGSRRYGRSLVVPTAQGATSNPG